MMAFYYGITGAVTLILWVLAELRQESKKAYRISYGLATIVLLGLTMDSHASLKQAYERLYIRNSLHEIGNQLNAGNTKELAESINKFDSNELNKGFAYAASQLWSDCGVIRNHPNKNKTSNKEDAPDKKAVR
jgi:hypothetical protein